jgi:hypothetical protein
MSSERIRTTFGRAVGAVEAPAEELGAAKTRLWSAQVSARRAMQRSWFVLRVRVTTRRRVRFMEGIFMNSMSSSACREFPGMVASQTLVRQILLRKILLKGLRRSELFKEPSVLFYGRTSSAARERSFVNLVSVRGQVKSGT